MSDLTHLNPIKPKLYWGLPGPRGGGGAHCAPLHNFYIFWLIAMKFGTDVKQVMIYKMVPSKFLKVTTWGRIFTKCDKKLGNMIEKIWHALKESNVWGSNSNITSVNDLHMWYFISLMIKKDIPYLELIYLLQLTVQTLNGTPIYHIKILNQHEMAPNTFYKWLNIPLKINVPCMEMMKTCCSDVNLHLESLSNCNFLNKIFFFLSYS